jgi:hypothetical protein
MILMDELQDQSLEIIRLKTVTECVPQIHQEQSYAPSITFLSLMIGLWVIYYAYRVKPVIEPVVKMDPVVIKTPTVYHKRTLTNTPRPGNLLGKTLVDLGYLDDEMLQNNLESYMPADGEVAMYRFGDYLVKNRAITQSQLDEALGVQGKPIPQPKPPTQAELIWEVPHWD